MTTRISPAYLSSNLLQKGFSLLGFLASGGLVGYGLAYLLVMPKVSPGGFVPQTIGGSAGTPAGFGMILAAFILLYAFAFIPVTVLFTIRNYSTSPFALVFAACLLCISLLLEIVNNLPLVAQGMYPGKFENISPEILLYLHQMEAIRYLAFDVAGFTIAYAAIFIYALVYFRTFRLLSWAIFASILLFVANVPFLWFAPTLAVTLMSLSIFAFAVVPVYLTRMTVE